MKILLVINSLEGGGAERVACTLAQHWDAGGHDVTIITLHGGPIAYEVPDSVKLHSLESRRLLLGPGRLAALPVGAYELAQFMRKLEPDATISFLARANLIHVLTRAFGNQRPIYISERSFSEAEYVGPRRVVGAMVRRLYPFATQIIAISKGVRESLGRMGVPLSKIITVYNPQSLAAIRAEAASGGTRAEGAPFRIVMSGRLAEPKDYETLLKALAILRLEKKLDVRLVVVGDGPDKVRLHERSRALGIADHVEWKGWTTKVHAVVGGCDAFTFASTWEGFGNVLVEAMACGLPIVATDCPSGPAEILENGKYGFLVPMRDAAGIANAVAELMTKPEVYAEYKRRALEGAERFDVETISARYLEIMTSASSGDQPALATS